jgi:hypothetical protein
MRIGRSLTRAIWHDGRPFWIGFFGAAIILAAFIMLSSCSAGNCERGHIACNMN